MKYLLPLSLLASAAWAAVHDTGSRLPAPAANAPAESSRRSDPPWLTGELALEDVAADEIDPPPLAGYGESYEDDPHAGLFLEDGAALGVCTRGDEDGTWSGSGVSEAEAQLDPPADPQVDPHGAPRAVARGVEPPRTPLTPSAGGQGHSIAELHAQRSKLAEQTVRVRGTVVKLTGGILGETYLHLRDGTGSSEREDDDLTVTTTEEFQLGETIEVEGRLLIDQDLGLGYRYPALLASAVRVAQR